MYPNNYQNTRSGNDYSDEDYSYPEQTTPTTPYSDIKPHQVNQYPHSNVEGPPPVISDPSSYFRTKSYKGIVFETPESYYTDEIIEKYVENNDYESLKSMAENSVIPTKSSLLLKAIDNGNTDIIKLILESHPTHPSGNNAVKTLAGTKTAYQRYKAEALTRAIENKDYEITEFLLDSPELTTEYLGNAFEKAVEIGDVNLINKLFEYLSNFGIRTPSNIFFDVDNMIILSLSKGNNKMVETLINNINSFSLNDSTMFELMNQRKDLMIRLLNENKIHSINIGLENSTQFPEFVQILEDYSFDFNRIVFGRDANVEKLKYLYFEKGMRDLKITMDLMEKEIIDFDIMKSIDEKLYFKEYYLDFNFTRIHEKLLNKMKGGDKVDFHRNLMIDYDMPFTDHMLQSLGYIDPNLEESISIAKESSAPISKPIGPLPVINAFEYLFKDIDNVTLSGYNDEQLQHEFDLLCGMSDVDGQSGILFYYLFLIGRDDLHNIAKKYSRGHNLPGRPTYRNFTIPETYISQDNVELDILRNKPQNKLVFKGTEDDTVKDLEVGSEYLQPYIHWGAGSNIIYNYTYETDHIILAIHTQKGYGGIDETKLPPTKYQLAYYDKKYNVYHLKVLTTNILDKHEIEIYFLGELGIEYCDYHYSEDIEGSYGDRYIYIDNYKYIERLKHSREQCVNKCIASRLMWLCGFTTVFYYLNSDPNDKHVISKYRSAIDFSRKFMTELENYDELMEAFLPICWLGLWNFYDGMFCSRGKLIFSEFGSSLTTRGDPSGGEDFPSDNVCEVFTLLDPKLNDSFYLFRDLSVENIVNSKERLRQVPDSEIRRLMDPGFGVEEVDVKHLDPEILISRKYYLLNMDVEKILNSVPSDIVLFEDQ